MHKWMFPVTALAVVSILFISTAVSEEAADHAAVGQAAPGFTLTDQEGNEVSLAEFQGKVVVLEWFNLECPFVVRHHEREKGIPGLQKEFAEQDVVWLAIDSSYDHDLEHNKKAHERLDLAYPILSDQSGEVGRLYRATHTPHIYVIDAEGTLRYQGAIDDDPQGAKSQEERTNFARNALQAVLAGEEVSQAETRAYGCTVKYK